MAFTGTATITQVSDKVCRITGLSLAISAAGTIGLFGSAGEVDLPAGFQPSAYSRPEGGTVDLAEAIQVSVVPAGATPTLVFITKTAAPFLATLTAGAAASGAMEIWVKYLG